MDIYIHAYKHHMERENKASSSNGTFSVTEAVLARRWNVNGFPGVGLLLIGLLTFQNNRRLSNISQPKARRSVVGGTTPFDWLRRITLTDSHLSASTGDVESIRVRRAMHDNRRLAEYQRR